MPAKSPYYARAAGKGLFVRRTDAASVRRRVLRTSGVLAALLLLDSGAAAALCASLRGWRAFPLSVLWRRAFGAEAFVGDAGDCLALALLRSLVLPALLVGGAAWAAPPSEKEARAAGGRRPPPRRRRAPLREPLLPVAAAEPAEPAEDDADDPAVLVQQLAAHKRDVAVRLASGAELLCLSCSRDTCFVADSAHAHLVYAYTTASDQVAGHRG